MPLGIDRWSQVRVEIAAPSSIECKVHLREALVKTSRLLDVRLDWRFSATSNDDPSGWCGDRSACG
jgi:hypothetical protein